MEMQKNTENKEFAESFRKIALPVGLQNLFFTSLGLIDTFMVGKLGQIEYNAVGLGGQYYFIINLIVVGLASSSVIYMAQYFGNNEIKGYRKSTGLAVISCLIVSLIAGIVAIFFPEKIISIFTKDPKIIDYGVQYLRIIGFQIPIISVIIPIAMASRAGENAKLPLKISIVSMSSNTILNYILIFGHLGFPKLEVRGAAYATLISSIISLLLYIILIQVKAPPLKGPLSDFTNISKEFIKKVFSTGWTIILHECLWSLGISTFIIVLSRLSTDKYTAYQIGSQFIRFAFIFTTAISSAGSVTIGMLLGRNMIDTAIRYEKKYSKLQILISAAAAVIIVFFSYFLVNIFKVAPYLQKSAWHTTIALCLFLPVRGYSGMLAAGILRAGGDTKIPVIYELFGIYFLNIPILYICLKYTAISLPYVIILASLGDLATAILLYLRVKKGTWANNLIAD